MNPRFTAFLFLPLLVGTFPGGALAAPDLTGQVVPTVTPGALQAQVSFAIQIKNVGNLGCNSMWWADFWAAYPCDCSVPPSECNQASDVNWEFSASDLGGGATVSKSFGLTLPPASTPYRYLLFVDSALGSFGNFCAEGNEANNIICGEYTVSGALAKPDLIIEQCVAQQDSDDLSMTKFSITVRNQGSAGVPVPVGVDLFVDGKDLTCADSMGLPGDAWAQVPPLAAGQSATVTTSVAVPGGPWELLAVANGFQEVSEDATANNCCSHGYEVADRPDLTVPLFSYSMWNAMPLFEGTVRNQGFDHVAPGQPFKLCLYYDRVDQPSPCETPDVDAGEGDVIEFAQGLDIGGELPFSLYGPELPNGVYSVWARVDCDCQILEADEKNNDAKEEVILDVPGPDLQIKVFAPKQELGPTGNRVRYMVVVTNSGTEPITDMFDLDFFFNVEPQPSPDTASSLKEGVYVQGPPLEPGAFFQTEVVWERADGIPDGTYTSWAILDLFSLWWETSETNNAKAAVVDVVTRSGPNLDLKDFKSRVIGNQVSFTVTVANNGDTDVETPFRIDLFRDREEPPAFGDLGDAFQEVAGLAAGASTTWESQWQQVPDGEYFAYALVDSPNVLVEGLEADNIAGPRILVVCSTCQLCPSDTYITSPCVCGEETVFSGFCCTQEWFALGCPSSPDEEADVAFPDGQVTELRPPLQRSSSCSFSQPQTGTGALACALLFALIVSLRFLKRRSPCL